MTVTGHVIELTRGIQCQIRVECKSFVTYSVTIDESTDITDIAQLGAFIRGVNEDFQTMEGLLELVSMKEGAAAD
jgi:hypothetical protein